MKKVYNIQPMKGVKMMKNETKRKLSIAKAVTQVGVIYIYDSLRTRLTPGLQGQFDRNELKIFRKAIVYKLTPFGNKEKQEKELEHLERKNRRLYKQMQEEAAKQKTKRR